MDVKVKICGLTNVEDALAAVAAGADYLGFVLWERSPRHVTVETAREIARQLPPATMRVGVFVDATVEQVMFPLRICDFAALQFHGQESPAYCQQFGGEATPYENFSVTYNACAACRPKAFDFSDSDFLTPQKRPNRANFPATWPSLGRLFPDKSIRWNRARIWHRTSGSPWAATSRPPISR